MKFLMLALGAAVLAMSLSACTGSQNGIRNTAPDRTVSQPRRGSY